MDATIQNKMVADVDEDDAVMEPEIFKPVAKKVLRRSSSERVDVSHLLQVNMCYAMSYVACYAIGVWHTTFALAGNSQTTSIFEAKFGWNEDETILYNTIISSSASVGLAIGSFMGGPMIKNGRRKGAIIANIIGIISSAITMVGTTPFLTFGRLLLGIASGIYNVIFGKMIVETLPEKLSQKLAMCHNASICVGLVVAYGMGAFLPDPTDA